tara:strand:+ start:154 stop:1569 length:1416 start_codon:yes stop_codon:yes gene_type:complete
LVTSLNKLKFQQTINEEFSISGIGLHTGTTSTLKVKPAPANHGIKFKRIDLKKSRSIEASVLNVIDVTRGTTIGVDGIEIHTIEHLLAAIHGLNIDNLLIEIDNIEVPILDGSAKEYVDLFIKSGFKEQDEHRLELVIDETITYSNPKSGVDIHIVPSDKFRITFMMDYKHQSLGTQYTSYYSIREEFINNVAPARTFCLLSEVNNLLDCDLIKGGSLDNSLVFIDKELRKEEFERIKKKININSKLINSSNGLLNDTELRYYNEPVRHKLLDLIGDLKLLGMPIKGHVIAARSGHFANIELVKNIKRKYFNKGADNNMGSKKQKISFDIREVLNILPHRYPFLLIDKINNLNPGKEVDAIKNVTFNEPFFQGHFSGQPVMPGVLLIESMAQAGGFLVLNTIPSPDSKLMYISAIESTRFKKVVVPGDQLKITARLLKFKLNTCKIEATIHVEGELVAESTFLASVVSRSV